MKLFIIGAGPAGISAALYAKRSGIETTIIYQDKTALETAHLIDNYYGVLNQTGLQIYETGIEQARNIDVELIKEEVVNINYGEQYEIVTTNNSYLADAVIIATGSYRNTPRIKNITKFSGKGVSYCATCDGFFYRNKKIAVLGNGSYCAHEASYLKNLTDNLIVYTNGEKIEDAELNEYNICTNKIKEVVGTDKIEQIVLDNGEIHDVDGLFIALGSAGGFELAKKLGIEVENNRIVTDENMSTNVEGIYACGDCVKGMLQIAKAVYEGAIAGTSATKYLNNKKRMKK